MALPKNQLVEEIFSSKVGRYDMVKLALAWIEVKKQDDDYRKLTQTELIDKALSDVVNDIATPEKIAELKKKAKPKEENTEEAAAAE